MNLKSKKLNIKSVLLSTSSGNYGRLLMPKPKPGIILQALKEFNINPACAILIKDKKSDNLAGTKSKMGNNKYIQEY